MVIVIKQQFSIYVFTREWKSTVLKLFESVSGEKKLYFSEKKTDGEDIEFLSEWWVLINNDRAFASDIHIENFTIS